MHTEQQLIVTAVIRRVIFASGPRQLHESQLQSDTQSPGATDQRRREGEDTGQEQTAVLDGGAGAMGDNRSNDSAVATGRADFGQIVAVGAAFNCFDRGVEYFFGCRHLRLGRPHYLGGRLVYAAGLNKYSLQQVLRLSAAGAEGILHGGGGPNVGYFLLGEKTGALKDLFVVRVVVTKVVVEKVISEKQVI